MAVIELNTTIRKETGKGPARKARRAGMVPGVAYGAGFDPVPLSLDSRDFQEFLRHNNPSTSLVKLAAEGDGELAAKVFIIKDIRLHHIERTPISVDFLAVDLKKPVTVPIPLVFDGIAEGIKTGGVVTPLIRSVEVSCLPGKIPATIHCDISELAEGDTWYVSGLAIPEEVVLKTTEETPLIACATPRTVVEEVEEKEEEEEEAEGAPEGEEGKEAKEGKEAEEGKEAKEGKAAAPAKDKKG